MELILATRDLGDRAVVAVSGEVDVYTAPQLDAALMSLVDAGTYRLVIDLGAVSFLDSTGLGVLVKALKRTREHDGSLDLVARDDRIIKVFRITGLDAVMPLHDSVEAALAADALGG